MNFYKYSGSISCNMGSGNLLYSNESARLNTRLVDLWPVRLKLQDSQIDIIRLSSSTEKLVSIPMHASHMNMPSAHNCLKKEAATSGYQGPTIAKNAL